MNRGNILVILGTDHHRFDRLVDWVDDLLKADEALSAVVQLGSTRSPKRAEGVPGILPHEELQTLTQTANLIVTHGGPATMWEVRRMGRKPVVVPRDPALGEHVDDHQLLFARRMAALGLVTLCEEQTTFNAAVLAGLASPDLHVVSSEDLTAERVRVAQAVNRTGQIIEQLAAEHLRRRRRGRRRRQTAMIR